MLDPDLERLEDLLAEFNLFDVLDIRHRELQHSAFLAWLLDPRGTHGLRDYFLRRFLSKAARAAQEKSVGELTPVDIDGWNLGDVEVSRERHHIDILLLSEADKFACLIENKIFSGESPGQLSGYLNTVKQEYGHLTAFPLFLTPEGLDPLEEEDRTHYVPMDYQAVAELIDDVLKTRRTTISTNVASFLEQYAGALRRHVLSTRDNTQALAWQIYDTHRAAIDLIIEAKSATVALGLDLVKPVVNQYAPDLQFDSQTKSILRFFATSLDDVPGLKQAHDWTPSNRLVLFEYKYESDKGLSLYLYVGPGGDGDTRKRLSDCAEHTFAKKVGYGKSFTRLYQRPVLSNQDYHQFDPAKAKQKIEKATIEFYRDDYWPLVNAIREEFGLSVISLVSGTPPGS